MLQAFLDEALLGPVHRGRAGPDVDGDRLVGGFRISGEQNLGRRSAASIGPFAYCALVEQILLGRREPKTAYRSCMALIRSAKRYDNARFDVACRRAIAIGAPTRKRVLAILSRGLNACEPVDAAPTQLPQTVHHENVRGSEYYDRKETAPS